MITDRRNPAAANLASRVISIPARIAELYTPIPYIIPAQLFAAALALEKNLDPDRPRRFEQDHAESVRSTHNRSAFHRG